MTTQLDKTFDPSAIEARWYNHWETNGLFRPHRPEAEPFTLVNPPPNVTGSLHIGHALDNTLQDVVVRYERLKGKDALWVVGTDHAGIATQMVVERNLASQGVKRTDMTRDEFVANVWEWKEQSGGAITRQLRRLGCSMDWSREQFTMDPHFTRAVVKVFVDLYNEGLIYRDKRLVNWDPKLKTAISDLEVETRDVQGKFWHLRYPLADGSGHISVATTRPETMLADMAVAVHPTDERYAALVARGAKVKLPITGREIPIVADEHADPELGSGAVKITPGHDFNDFEVGKRAGIAPADMLNMLDAEARVVQCGGIPEHLVGLDRFEARERVVEMLDAQGLLEGVEDRTIPTPFGDRGGVVIEPWLTDQWYVDAETLAQAPMQAVRDGRIEIVPKAMEKTFFNWMENIQPWCVSRQLWWGHRIPAWYGPVKDDVGGLHQPLEEREDQPNVYQMAQGQRAFVAPTEAEAIELAREYYGSDWTIEVRERPEIPFKAKAVILTRDPDVLDTWFSSALWPFATLGWPEDSPLPLAGGAGGGPDEDSPTPNPSRKREGDLLARHYPNDLLISGTDILFFWDARMAMQGMKFMGDVPWRRLYLHGLVRAADGQKMSKSKGNVVDPLGLIDKYGADALRFFMAAMESHGRDVKMDESRVEGYRNFATKLWNATRFCQANGIGASETLAAPPATSAVNKWIVGEVIETLAALDKAMTDLRFDAAANAIYQFAWGTFCDWYLELIKTELEIRPESDLTAAEQEVRANEARKVCGWVLDQILVMLHPFMPFITEELWHAQGSRPYDLILAKWPEPEATADAEAKRAVEWVIDLIKSVRAARADLNIPPSQKLTWTITQFNDWTFDAYFFNQQAIRRLARIDRTFVTKPLMGLSESPTGLSRVYAFFEDRKLATGPRMQITTDGFLAFAELEGVIDIDAEKARLGKALEGARKEAAALAGRLGNANFVERAKPEAVDKARADHAHHTAEAERLEAALARLG